MKEWKDIKGFEGFYKVSNNGEIYSFHTNKIMVGRKNNKGYLHVCLSKNGVVADRQVHRIVAEAFLENKNNLPFVNRKDENPLNNNLSNLEWCTHLYNVRYSMSLHPERSNGETLKKIKKSSKYRKHDKRLFKFDKNNNLVEIYENLSTWRNESLKNEWSIIQCCYGKRKTAYGYKWKFAE